MWQLTQFDFATGQTLPWVSLGALVGSKGAWQARHFRVIVGRRIAYQLLVRIVAGDAADPGVGAVEAFAIGETVGLEANIGLAMPVAAHHCLPTAMALSAEIRQVFGGQAAELLRHGAHVAFDHAGEMGAGADVAVFAGDTGFGGG